MHTWSQTLASQTSTVIPSSSGRPRRASRLRLQCIWGLRWDTGAFQACRLRLRKPLLSPPPCAFQTMRKVFSTWLQKIRPQCESAGDYSSIREFSSLRGTVYSMMGCPENLTLHFIVLRALPSPGRILGSRHPDGSTDVLVPPPHPQPGQELVMVQLLYLTFPPNRGSFLGLKTELHLRPLIQIPHTHPPKNQLRIYTSSLWKKNLTLFRKSTKYRRRITRLL